MPFDNKSLVTGCNQSKNSIVCRSSMRVPPVRPRVFIISPGLMSFMIRGLSRKLAGFLLKILEYFVMSIIQ